MPTFADLLQNLQQQASTRDCGGPKEKCPKKTKPALFVMVASADGTALSGVNVEISGAAKSKKSTGGDGIARFDPTKAGGYLVKAVLTDDQAKKYLPPPITQVMVPQGQTATLGLSAPPLPFLQVIVDRSDTHAVVAGMKVQLTGPATLEGSTAPNSGMATFNNLKPGRYEVKLAFTDAQLKDFMVPVKTSVDVVVGKHNLFQFHLPPRAHVHPVLNVAAPKTVMVKRAYMDDATHQQTPHRLPVRITVSAAFDGTGRLLCNKPDKVKLFPGLKGGTALTFPLTLTNPQLVQGLNAPAKSFTLYLEGAQPSGAPDDIELSLELLGGTAVTEPPVTEKITAIRLKLEVHKCRPDDGSDPAAFSEAEKLSPGRYVLLADAEVRHERALVTVHPAEPASFKGKLSLVGWDKEWEIKSDHLALFDAEVPAKGQAAHPSPHEFVNPGAPVKFWIEGTKASEDLRDLALRYRLADLAESDDARFEGDRIVCTVVDLGLEVGQSRPASNAEPKAMPGDKCLDPGRFLQKRDTTDFLHGRAKVTVARVNPAAFRGSLELRVWDVTAKSTANPRLAFLQVEVPATGQAEDALPIAINHDAAYPAKGKVWWVEGAKESAALRDTELQLQFKDHFRAARRVAFTVVEFTKLKVTIKSTPAHTVRAGVAAPADHTFESTKLKESFAETDNPPLVLMRDGQPDVALEVETKPAGPVKLPILWRAIRNPADAATLGKKTDLPTLTPDVNDTRKCVLDCNEKGSFRIRPYIDCNKEDEYSPREPSMPLNLVLINATIVSNATHANPAKATLTLNAGGLSIVNGAWAGGPGTLTPGDLGGAGMQMEIVTRVTGGGANGRLGLERLFAGLINDLRNVAILATYRNNSVAPVATVLYRNLYVLNPGAATGVAGTTPVFKPTDPPPNILAFPILDTGKAPGGNGGDSATMSRSGTTSKVDAAVGQNWTVRCIDSPARGFSLRHPIVPAARLESVDYVHEFSAFFCFWTNFDKNAGPNGKAAERTYSVILHTDWGSTGNWTITYPNAGSFAPTAVNPNTPPVLVPAAAGGTTHNPIARAQDTDVEVRPPSGISAGIAFSMQ